MSQEAYYTSERERMVEEQFIRRDITDKRVLSAMRKVPRHYFVPEEHRHMSYHDCPLPIGEGQTISQPYIVALMTQMLKLEGHEIVLEIGTGSGYQAAILSLMAEEVHTIERHEILAKRAGAPRQPHPGASRQYRLRGRRRHWDPPNIPCPESGRYRSRSLISHCKPSRRTDRPPEQRPMRHR